LRHEAKREKSVKKRKLRILIVGAGDVARRLTTRIGLNDRACWLGLARSEATAIELRDAGILPVTADLDVLTSLRRAGALGRSADAVLHLAPPAGEGHDDVRMRRWLAASAYPRVSGRAKPAATGRQRPGAHIRRRARALRAVYVSTTGVYGDCAGERIDETRRARPENARAKRRVAAEVRVRASRGQRFAILRAPGIYAAERLPVERLRAGTPALSTSDDVFTNHIHADDLARAVWLAIFRGAAGRIVNIVDDSELRMGEYFDQVADAVSLPRPPRMDRVQLKQNVSPMLYSFMSESRRIGNMRMKRELRLRLKYATPTAFLRQMKPAAALQRTLL
jgi:nucleoside-diphosphate-sugar epimerase